MCLCMSVYTSSPVSYAKMVYAAAKDMDALQQQDAAYAADAAFLSTMLPSFYMCERLAQVGEFDKEHPFQRSECVDEEVKIELFSEHGNLNTPSKVRGKKKKKKKALCKSWHRKGHCKFGERCRFGHPAKACPESMLWTLTRRPQIRMCMCNVHVLHDRSISLRVLRLRK